ncbi:uncharacterized protein [Spinacia oleracea]|uniref:Endonuclease/exonuclease/phosphatase domain-containing protein n=1 Tax=Spinacia oleracea TaxID=3562 RepID=A0A9R0I9W4_SPIOL|nr:uncharacterized protein LOC110785172 [Spinacia oleracea]
MESRDKVLQGHYFFDSKPLIVKPWDQDLDMDKEEVQVVPIWIQLKLNFKYWSEKALFKIVSQVGKPIKRDYATTCRDKIQFARDMVEVPMEKILPDHLFFMDEHGEKVKVDLRYEWKPTLCNKCKMVGHAEAECRQGNSRKKETIAIEVDQEGFQRALRPIRVRADSVEPAQIANPFDILQNEEMVETSVNVTDRGGNLSRQEGLVGLLKHKVKGANLGKLYQRVFTGWCFTGNVSFHKGGTIVVAWKLGSFTVSVVAVTAQLIHCHVTPISGKNGFYCTFVYAFNECKQRIELWRDLKVLNTQDPWIMCGDFNCVMASNERIGAPARQAEINDINSCMHVCSMEDVKSVGNMFTWNNKQQGSARVFSKLDRVLANPAWQSEYVDAEVCFMNEGDFDHSPGLLTVYPRSAGGRKPFRYFTMWKSAPTFDTIIQDVWREHLSGSKMYVLVTKLKKVKVGLKELNKKGFTDIQAAEIKAHQAMLDAQQAMHSNPANQQLVDLELDAIKKYKLHHQSIKARNVQNHVYSIYDMHGKWQDTPEAVSDAFLDYYKQLLGTTQAGRRSVIKEVVLAGPVITEHHRALLNAHYSREEVKNALFSIPGTKAPGPDGFGSFFYKDSWHIVGDEVIDAVLDVLNNGKLLKEINHTVIL